MNQRRATIPRPLGRRDFWVGLLLGAGVVLTTMTCLVFGWFIISFHFFGDTADADDYRVAAGVYGAAALVLAMGAIGVWTWRAPKWELVWASAAAAVLTALAVSALADASTAEPGTGYNGWLDGAGGVIACPWTWPLIVLGIWGPLRSSRWAD